MKVERFEHIPNIVRFHFSFFRLTVFRNLHWWNVDKPEKQYKRWGVTIGFSPYKRGYCIPIWSKKVSAEPIYDLSADRWWKPETGWSC